MNALRPLLFWPGFAAGVLLYTLLFIGAAPLPLRRRLHLSRSWARFNRIWIRWTLAIDVEVRGLENIPDEPVVVMCKHQSTWETLVLQSFMPLQSWVLKRELLWIPVFGWGLAMAGPIALDRARGRQAVEQLVEKGRKRLLEDRLNVLIFPEGTRTAPGHRRRYKIGGALLAEATGVPVLPVAHNAGHLWPRRRWAKRPGTVTVVIGPPIPTEGLEATRILERVETWIESTVEEIGAPD